MSKRSLCRRAVLVVAVLAWLTATTAVAQTPTPAPVSVVKLVYVHVDFKDPGTAEASGLLVVPPQSGKINAGAGVIWPCGAAKPISFSAPPDHVAKLTDSPCTPSKPAKWGPFVGTIPWILVVPKVLHPGASKIDTDTFQHLDVATSVKRETIGTDVQLFDFGSSRSMSLDRLQAKLKTTKPTFVVTEH